MSLVRRTSATLAALLTAATAVVAIGTPTASAVVPEPPRPAFDEAPAVLPGANGAVIWPFVGNNGPMGKEAAEIGFDQAAIVTRVAATADAGVLAAGLDDGRVWVCEVKSGRLHPVKSEKGAAITALAVAPKGDRLAWGDEDGGAGVADLPPLGA